MKSKKMPEPEDHYGDNPPDEAPQEEQADTSLPNSYKPFDESTLKEYHTAMSNIASRAKGTRSEAADKLLNSGVEVRE